MKIQYNFFLDMVVSMKTIYIYIHTHTHTQHFRDNSNILIPDLNPYSIKIQININ